MSGVNNEGGNPQAGSGRPLPKKEADLFKNVVKFYETKQYKKGLKNADTILKRFPNHGETLCMKGLIVNSMGEKFKVDGKADQHGGGKGDHVGKTYKEESVELIKKGLMMDMRSVWVMASCFVLLSAVIANGGLGQCLCIPFSFYSLLSSLSATLLNVQ